MPSVVSGATTSSPRNVSVLQREQVQRWWPVGVDGIFMLTEQTARYNLTFYVDLPIGVKSALVHTKNT